MNKRKIMTLALSICMVAILAIGGSIAYFTDTDKADNVFVIGNVDIEQIEQERTSKTDATLKEFSQNKNVQPAVHDKLAKSEITVDGYTFKIRSLEGNYVDKIVNVKNNGTEPAYIRTIIAVPNMNGWDDDRNATQNPLHWNFTDASDFKGIGWDWDQDTDVETDASQLCYAENVEIGGKYYDLYVATYNAAVAANAITSPSMVGFYLDDDVDYDAKEGKFVQFKGAKDERDLSPWMAPDQNGKATLKFLVATQACQTEGFANAWEALDEAFGKITGANHPWAE